MTDSSPVEKAGKPLISAQRLLSGLRPDVTVRLTDVSTAQPGEITSITKSGSHDYIITIASDDFTKPAIRPEEQRNNGGSVSTSLSTRGKPLTTGQEAAIGRFFGQERTISKPVLSR